MVVLLEEAVSVLKKWHEERRVIQVGLVVSTKSGCHIVGRIERLDSESLRIDARSIREIGRRNAVEIRFSDVRECRFEDWREAPAEHAAQLREAFEAFLFLRLGNCHCELYAMKTRDEAPPQ